MENSQFLQQLHDLSLEEGYSYIRSQAEKLTDIPALGNAIKDEALRQQNIDAFTSLKLAELLMFFGDYVQHEPSYALGLIAKGDALRCIGDHQGALLYLDRAGERFLRLGDEVGWARSRIGWILAAAWVGKASEALQAAEQAREALLRHGEYYRACTVDHNTAIVYTRLGRYHEALALYERMQTVYATLTDQNNVLINTAMAMAQCTQASCLFWLGDFERAYQLLQQARERFIALGHVRLIIMSEINLADFDYAQGYYGSALSRYYHVHDRLTQEHADDPTLLVIVKRNLADCLVKLDRIQEAYHYTTESVEMSRQLGVSLDTGEVLCEYAKVLEVSGRPKEALEALNEALELFSSGGLDHYVSATQLQRSELLLALGEYERAYKEAYTLKAYFDAHGLLSRSVHAGLLLVGSLIMKAQHEQEQQSPLLREAVVLCRQAISLALRHNLQEQVYQGQHLLGRLAVLQGDTAAASKRYGAAIAQIECILDDLVHDLSPSFLHTTWRVYEDMISLCLMQGQAEQAFHYLERARSVVLRQYLDKVRVPSGKRAEAEETIASAQARSAAVARVQRELAEWQQSYRNYSMQLAVLDTLTSPVVDPEVIQKELKHCEAKLNELFERLHLYKADTYSPSYPTRIKSVRHKVSSTPHLDIAYVYQRLAPDQLLLSYFLSGEKLVIFAITGGRVHVHEHADGAAQVERLRLLLHAHLQPEGWPDRQHPPQQAIRRILNRLYGLLVAPVKALLPSAGSLTIVPYGPLHTLPFHALYDGFHFLIEDFQINYLPTSSLLKSVDTGNREEGKRNSLPEVEGGKQVPLIFGYSDNGRLPHVPKEAEALAGILNGRCYLENEATSARLFKEAPGSPLIHIATHGNARLDAPNFASLLLADGRLTALDAFNLDLKHCELVTLSGCETGLALSSGGDEQLGLGRAFLASGASSLLISLWLAEDSATYTLMRRFYHYLLSGENKAQALRLAQCSLLHDETSLHYTHPYYWAAFRLVGDIGPFVL